MTIDDNYLVMSMIRGAERSNLIYYADLRLPECALDGPIKFTPLIDEWFAGFSYLFNEDSRFYFGTNYEAPQFRMISIDLNNPGKDHWKEIIPEPKGDIISGASKLIDNDKLIYTYSEDLVDKMNVWQLPT
jgi:prolyl oligopeptidase